MPATVTASEALRLGFFHLIETSSVTSRKTRCACRDGQHHGATLRSAS